MNSLIPQGVVLPPWQPPAKPLATWQRLLLSSALAAASCWDLRSEGQPHHIYIYIFKNILYIYNIYILYIKYIYIMSIQWDNSGTIVGQWKTMVYLVWIILLHHLELGEPAHQLQEWNPPSSYQLLVSLGHENHHGIPQRISWGYHISI